jgi:hypothetical protein
VPKSSILNQTNIAVFEMTGHNKNSEQIPRDVILGTAGSAGFVDSQPVLHVHSDGVQVLAAPAMEADHLSLCGSRAEVAPYLIAEGSVLPSAADECDRSQDSGPFFHAGVVVAVDAGQHLMWVVKLDLHEMHAFDEKLYRLKSVSYFHTQCSKKISMLQYAPCVLSGHHFHVLQTRRTARSCHTQSEWTR